MRALLVLLLLTGCSHRSEDEKLIQSMSGAKSWAASLAYSTELWVKNRVPTSLVRNGAKSVRKEVESGRKAIEKSKASAALKKQLGDDLSALDSAAGAVERAIASHDGRAVAAAITLCERAHDDLESLEKK